MIRASIAGILGFLLLIFESLIVMHLKGYQTIEYGGIAPFINVWAMNFFLVFSILTQINDWFENRESIDKGNEDNNFYT
ncbi:hypothetical protein [Neobacillus sp. PS3-40]|uniref:hypothetical protein n=1 Tax=Neobacillus sp. PS3-40 TaxID=3070679 RepID=UPI0027DFAF1C|nr:hypothetical protein [Neobacillus sp. PS3-40]WML43044.1 hypothetical protein RCG20_14590 [Neobacillus sp. PS3-40]